MKSPTIQTQAIVLARIDYGEADRIITVLTPDRGKLRLLAKGVRRVKSKLAGGIELFSISDISYLPGRGEIGTLVSTRLSRHYGAIIQDLERVQLGYELLKQVNKLTEDQAESGYFSMVSTMLEALNNRSVGHELVKAWFQAQIIALSGHMPNLETDSSGARLSASRAYAFDFDQMAFAPQPGGPYDANFIKIARLLFRSGRPDAIAKIQGLELYLPKLVPFSQNLYNLYV